MKKKKYSKFKDVKEKLKQVELKKKAIFTQARDEVGGKSFFEARKTVERLEKAKINISKRVKLLQDRQNMRLIGHVNGLELLEKRKLIRDLQVVEKEFLNARKKYKQELTKLKLPNVKKQIHERIEQLMKKQNQKCFINNLEKLRLKLQSRTVKMKRRM